MNTTFDGNLLCSPCIGHTFVIAGKLLDIARRLDISFQSEKTDDCDVPLHISARFDTEFAIVRNSRQGGEWGAEERTENRTPFTVENPLIVGEYFRVLVLVGDDCFHIAVNDEPYCRYAFRAPLSDIRCVRIDRDLQALTQMDHRSAFPVPFPALLLGDREPGMAGRIELSADWPAALRAGHVLVMTGIAYGSASGSFQVRLMENGTQRQLLHFNPRFNPDNVVVRNAMNDKLEYGPEERDGDFPFNIDEQFILAIACCRNGFRFAVNGIPLGGLFVYRSDKMPRCLSSLKVMAVGGMHLEVTGVDHVPMDDEECVGFQTFSHPDGSIVNVD